MDDTEEATMYTWQIAQVRYDEDVNRAERQIAQLRALEERAEAHEPVGARRTRSRRSGWSLRRGAMNA